MSIPQTTLFCCCTVENDAAFSIITAEPNCKSVLKHLERNRKQRGETRFICGYEAGSLGYSLQRELSAHGVECVILAPSTMPKASGKRIKTDKRDAENIARCPAYHQYKAVYRCSERDRRLCRQSQRTTKAKVLQNSPAL